MECFRQIFRCARAPFKREKGRVIEIGPPTNFRKEELPACFSDAESVLSPNQDTTERSDLTTQSQDPDVTRQSHNDRGEGRNNDRDDAAIAVDQGQGPKSCPPDERAAITKRICKRMNVSRWWNPSSTSRDEKKTSDDLIGMKEIRSD
ncbi:unnamed protein product [Penicillium salamii]|uniref:Uncharacterized protein n=1 Tax=Penicillium salamii TaxID=1612424 RepID=A0A9W4IU86_9EURO|nr:unnamed protein product [Penicillium salamii]CAG8047092.1 unnamed protein product [Penicillium salamii]CAG8337943.1 unnamed protein product [Penicillium salamii]CAG8337951.1 unnamed protein product [Penicillium salamii]CAG8346341.1 unnamed protein product [Penicillium salamii]